jgi:hypothetical protein
MTSLSVRSLLFCAALVVVVSGCPSSGPPAYEVKGTVLQNGKPMLVKSINGQRLGVLKISLIKQDGVDPLGSRSANIREDGTFAFEGDMRPLAGTHKVCIEWKDDFSSPDKLGKKFDEKNSKIVRKFPEDKELNIDVSKPEG